MVNDEKGKAMASPRQMQTAKHATTEVRRGRQLNFGGSLPKTASLQEEWRRCGRATCRCRQGPPHGPYLYLRWREGARQRRRYVPREQVPAIREALEQHRRLRPPAWSLRQELAELRRLTQEVSRDTEKGNG